MTTQDIVYRSQKGFALSIEAQRLLQLLAEKYGINQKAVLEVVLRNTARQEGIPIE